MCAFNFDKMTSRLCLLAISGLNLVAYFHAAWPWPSNLGGEEGLKAEGNKMGSFRIGIHRNP